MRRRIIYGLVLLAALAVVALFMDSGVFVVRDVKINGESGMAYADVVRAAGVDMGGRMRQLDVEAIVRNVEASGELRCTGVEKDYPSTIIINVERRVGRVVTDFGGSVVLMDEKGYVIGSSREMPEGNYVYVTGLAARDAVPGRLIGSDSRRVAAMCEVVAAIDECGAADYVSELNVDDADSMYLYSRTGIQVMLGEAEDLENKIIWMKYALMDLESRGETSGKLDVTGGKQADFSAD